MAVRSPWDREIARLALPALGALAAEPLYLLADTAVVGHLGTEPLAGLAVAASILLTAHSLCIFLAYGTTAAVARLLGAGDERGAAHQAVQGLWLAAGLGVVLAAAGAAAAPALVGAFGAEGDVVDLALLYFRCSLPGLPALLVVLAGTGYLRGRQDTRTPFVVALASAAANVVLEVLAIPVLGFGLGASALTTVVVQWGAAAVYVRAVTRGARDLGVGLAPRWVAVRRLLAVGGALVLRTGALRGALLLATFVAARISTVALAAHQVAFELWSALAYALDALAIAGQAIVGRLLGAGDAAGARAAGRRMLELGTAFGVAVAAVVLVARPWLPALFSGDGAVRDATAFVLLFVAVLQPLNAVVFVLDGLLIGAGDLAFLARAMPVAAAVFAVAAGAVLAAGAGLGWLWAALGLFMAARAVPLAWRWRGDRWAVLGSI